MTSEQSADQTTHMKYIVTKWVDTGNGAYIAIEEKEIADE